MAKTIVITGASTGIGRATAIYFASKGWNVIATMRKPEVHDDALEQPNITKIALDVTDEVSIVRAMSVIQEQFGRVDVLLNNAGYGLFGPLEALTSEHIHKQFSTNVYGVMHCMRHVIPMMRNQGGGVIINVSSIAGRMSFPFTSVYHATKFALEGFSDSMRFELASSGIRIKLIEPGGVKTDFNSRSLEFVAHESYEPQLTNYQKLLKDDRFWAKPEEIAKIIFVAAMDRSNRLRYLAKPGIFYMLHRIMPDCLWLLLGRIMLKSRL